MVPKNTESARLSPHSHEQSIILRDSVKKITVYVSAEVRTRAIIEGVSEEGNRSAYIFPKFHIH